MGEELNARAERRWGCEAGRGQGWGAGARPEARASCGVLGRLDFIPSQDGGGAGT